MSEIVITPLDNGPLLVKGPAVLKDAIGNDYVVDKPMIAMCRCGDSANKPFCDGAHKSKFESACRAPV